MKKLLIISLLIMECDKAIDDFDEPIDAVNR